MPSTNVGKDPIMLDQVRYVASPTHPMTRIHHICGVELQYEPSAAARAAASVIPGVASIIEKYPHSALSSWLVCDGGKNKIQRCHAIFAYATHAGVTSGNRTQRLLLKT